MYAIAKAADLGMREDCDSSWQCKDATANDVLDEVEDGTTHFSIAFLCDMSYIVCTARESRLSRCCM